MPGNREAVLFGFLAVLLIVDGTESFKARSIRSGLSSLVPEGLKKALEIPVEELEKVADTAAAITDGLAGKEEKKECFEKLGCFSLGAPWISLARPLPAPWSPFEILASVTLYTRDRPEGFHQSFNTTFTLYDSDFDPNRQTTAIITHGFASNGDSDWLHELKDAYLNNVDANVFIMDWGKGASLINYLQVASNTRIVGAQLAKYIRFLIKNGQTTEKLHLIGHSLGSHIMSYGAKQINEISKVKRITALDPAQPGFEGQPKIVRLDRSDAENIDVYHTDAKPFLPFLGFGMMSPVGSVDFYFNGGALQPGCLEVQKPNITSLTDLLSYPVEVVSEWVSCSHGRSYQYFTTALELKNCSFWGRKMSHTENFLKVSTLGRLTLADPIIDSLTTCTKETCIVAGLDTFKMPARGSFAVTTKPEPPFCESKEDDKRHLKNLLTLGLYDQTSKYGRKFIDKLSLI